ncbi:MAG TPA: hypothetical protein VIJ94_20845 [Caulobacteraceae bacterium]
MGIALHYRKARVDHHILWFAQAGRFWLAPNSEHFACHRSKSVGGGELIYIGKLALIGNELTQLMLCNELCEVVQFPEQRISDSLVTRVFLSLSDFAPVVDKSIWLELQKLNSLLVEQPYSRDAGARDELQLERGHSALPSRPKRLEIWGNGRLVFHIWKTVSEDLTKRPYLGEGKAGKGLKLD